MAVRDNFIFTSESVGEGHPDKVCDIISDAILDQALAQDSDSRVACECFLSRGVVLVGGEISTQGYIDVTQTVRNVLTEIGYDNPSDGIDSQSCAVLSLIQDQSSDIAQGVSLGEGLHKEQGAGDQGIMFGYACRETDALMPAPLQFAHRLMQRASLVRKEGILDFLRPDAKCQVSVRYENGQPVHIDTVVLSQQHREDVEQSRIEEALIETVIRPSLPPELLSEKTCYHINPTGRFVIGGPHADTGLTGRKIIVDTYGGYARHGGGAFSGKDPSKVDRSASYMARYIAKNLVAARFADSLELQIAYAIGVAEPVALYVRTDGTALLSPERLEEGIRNVFDLTPAGIINALGLKKTLYQPTAAYGHFGREQFPWEKLDRVDELRRVLLS